MIGAFRQPLGIPDDILPDAWRRTIDDEIEEEFHDPCATHIVSGYSRPLRRRKLRGD